ncbi:hypothetical protein DENSPDRAFT_876749 [Dentipellis sp. KUC8613]|nr:hypothetical protein DENSPDRAFT_876749 [Dentipellis sp. KUC8613]
MNAPSTPAIVRAPFAVIQFHPGPFYPIPDSHALAVTDANSPAQLEAWEALPGVKIFIRIFDQVAHDSSLHPHLSLNLLCAVVQATGEPDVKIAAPSTNPSTPGLPRGPVPAFMLYNISSAGADTLLRRGVWSSATITFQVIPFDPSLPDFLLVVSGFTTDDAATVKDAVLQHWLSETSLARFMEINTSIAEQGLAHLEPDELVPYLKSLVVEKLEMKTVGGEPAPWFNISADSSLIHSDELWFAFRHFMRQLRYTTNFHGTGTCRGILSCSLCHAITHPRGLCPFPELPGWEGPLRRVITAPCRGRPARPATRLT